MIFRSVSLTPDGARRQKRQRDRWGVSFHFASFRAEEASTLTILEYELPPLAELLLPCRKDRLQREERREVPEVRKLGVVTAWMHDELEQATCWNRLGVPPLPTDTRYSRRSWRLATSETTRRLNTALSMFPPRSPLSVSLFFLPTRLWLPFVLRLSACPRLGRDGPWAWGRSIVLRGAHLQIRRRYLCT